MDALSFGVEINPVPLGELTIGLQSCDLGEAGDPLWLGGKVLHRQSRHDLRVTSPVHVMDHRGTGFSSRNRGPLRAVGG